MTDSPPSPWVIGSPDPSTLLPGAVAAARDSVAV